MRKRRGACTLCDREIFDIVERFAVGALDGEPRKVGRPHDDACRVTLLLADGSHCDVTFCATCVPEVGPATLPTIWRKTMGAFAHERENYTALSPQQQAPTPEQAAKVEADLIRLRANVPLGVLRVETWADIAAREKI